MMGGTATYELLRLLATPTLNTPILSTPTNAIAIAHAALEELRATGDPNFIFFRVLVEQQFHLDNEELFFHCITGARQVMLWRWTHGYSRHFLDRMRDGFLMFGQRQVSSKVCQRALVNSACALWKRGWGEEEGSSFSSGERRLSAKEQAILSLFPGDLPVLQSRADLFMYLQQVMAQDASVGSSILESMVIEFGSHSAVEYRLPLNFHRQAHSSFQANGFLTEALRLCITAIAVNGPEESLVTATSAILHWESNDTAFANDISMPLGTTPGTALIRAPAEWRDLLVRPELCDCLFQAAPGSHAVRQLIGLFASITNPVFASVTEQQQFASCLCEGTFQLLQLYPSRPGSQTHDEAAADVLLDVLSILSRLISNHQFSILLQVPCFTESLLQLFVSIGESLLHDHISECEHARGNVDDMAAYEWREQALTLVIECTVWLCGDAWVLYSASEAQRSQLASVIGVLFTSFVQCRTRMASLEEIFLHDTDLDEVREGITETNLAEEMESVAAIGRLDLAAALSTLSNLFGSTLARLQIVWKNSGEEISAESAAVLEETRLLTLYIGHLLSDNPEGETPSIPPLILASCKSDESAAALVTGAVEALLELIRFQQQFLLANNKNAALSPMLAKTFLWFLIRWIPAYVDPIDVTGPSYTENRLILDWVTRADQTVEFCMDLCMTYLSQWPLETLLQDSVFSLLLMLARNGSKLRRRLFGSSSFHELVKFHCLTASLRHDIPRPELAKLFQNCGPLIWGYHRLPYVYRSTILTFIVTACSDDKETGDSILMESLGALHNAFAGLTRTLSSSQVSPDESDTRELAALCIEMFCGLMKTTDIANPEKIANFAGQYFMPLANLMKFYATDLTVCTALLRFFRDFSAHFLPFVDTNQTSMLLQACGELVMSYTSVHCSSSRNIHKFSKTEAEASEGQAYEDIYCLLQLLISIGTKEYLDACSQNQGSHSQQVVEMTFYGLQQILPLMTQGLMEHPDLCYLFFEFVSFITENHSARIHSLSAPLLHSLMEVLMFGMSNTDAAVGKSSLQGLTHIFRESSNGSLLQHVFDVTVNRLFTDVIFQRIIADRVEAAGAALLPFLEADCGRVATQAEGLASKVQDDRQRECLGIAFTKLLRPEIISKTRIAGHEGRANRKEFKRLFEKFVAETQAFLVLR